MARPTRDERGSATVEAAIGVPAFLLLTALLVLGGRIAIATQVVHRPPATPPAWRHRYTAASARADASTAARHSLTNQDLACATTSVTVDTSAFGTAVGTAGQVRHVTCGLPLGDLGVPGLSGTKTITATMSSPLDTYRER